MKSRGSEVYFTSNALCAALSGACPILGCHNISGFHSPTSRRAYTPAGDALVLVSFHLINSFELMPVCKVNMLFALCYKFEGLAQLVILPCSIVVVVCLFLVQLSDSREAAWYAENAPLEPQVQGLQADAEVHCRNSPHDHPRGQCLLRCQALQAICQSPHRRRKICGWLAVRRVGHRCGKPQEPHKRTCNNHDRSAESREFK